MASDDRSASHLLPPLLAGAAAVGAGAWLVRAAIRRRRHYDLAGRVAIVTGGSRGLGLELARQLLERGAHVAICARDEADLRDAALDLRRRGGTVFSSQCDVTDPGQIERFIEQVRAELGPIDVLINNAGIITVGPFDAQNAEDFEQSYATHVTAPLTFAKSVLPDMRSRGGGRIANVASIGGLQPVPHMSAYVTSKHALVGLTQSMRAELADDNVLVTLVCPGTVQTGSPYAAGFKGDPEAEYGWFAASDNLPVLAIPAPALAGQILDAIEDGDAELVTPANAWLSSLFHGMFSGVSTELATLVNALLPSDGGVRRLVRGREASVGQLPDILERRQARRAAEFNQGERA